MKVPANLSADKLIRDYLARVTEAGLRYLPKGQRIAFVGRTRSLIERECGPSGLADPGRVMEVLAGLGEPEELVRQERARIDAAWLRRRAGDSDSGSDAITVPREHRPITSRWKPATTTQPLPGPPRTARADAAARRGRLGRAARGGRLGPTGRRGGLGPAGGAGGAQASGSRPRPAALPPRAASAALARASWRLARRHWLETAAIIVLGIGGAIFPLQLWPAGALMVLGSRFFDARDKWIALAGPLALVLAGGAIAAAILPARGNLILFYLHAAWLGFGYVLRAGALLGAGYLGWRLQRGPRVRVPPWRR